jgi:pantetheine-phosphate adenylyltransferase
MNRIAVFPGSFDPITLGHESIVRRALPLFDEIIIAVGENTTKNYMFSVEKRMEFLRIVFSDCPDIRIDRYSGLTVEYCRKLKSKYILRGLRTSADFEFERSIGQVNKLLYPEIENIFFLTLPEHTAINSSIVRDIILHKGDTSCFVPKSIHRLLTNPDSQ